MAKNRTKLRRKMILKVKEINKDQLHWKILTIKKKK